MYQVNDRVIMVYRVYEESGMTVRKIGQVAGTVTRIWANGKDMTILTDDNETFVRRMSSPEVRHIV